jgi:cellulose synthase/poly-beta-1,6-N-acetylglucosamine synthase-like glycosyltransferase
MVLLFAYYTYYLLSGFWDQLGNLASVPRVMTGTILIWTGLLTLAIAVRYVALMTSAYLAHRALDGVADDASLSAREWPSVSIIVPAYNEGDTIERSLASLITLEYPDFEILVVDDGSTDRTLALAEPFTHLEGQAPVRLFTKINGGKATALNLGIQHATGDLILTIDADSDLAKDALRELVPAFDDPKVAACSGQVRVRNRVNLLTRLQAMEYFTGNGIVRRAQAYFRHVLIMPGPIAMFRAQTLRTLAEEASLRAPANPAPGLVPGPFESDTLAEDCDLTLGVLAMGDQVAYAPKALAFTKAPEYMYELFNQRYRWTRGVLQAAYKRFSLWRKAKNRSLEFLVWLGILLFELVVWSVAELTGIVAIITILLTQGLSDPFLFILLLLTTVDLNAAVFSALVEDDDLTLTPLVVLQRFYYGPLMAIQKVFACWDQIRGRRASWS